MTHNETIVNVSAITDHKSDSETNRNMSTSTSTFFFTITSSAVSTHQDNASLNPMIVSIAVAQYSSGIIFTPLPLSSSTPYSRFTNIAVLRELIRTSVSQTFSIEVLKAGSGWKKNIDT